MKKQITALVSGAVAAIFLLSAAGCGGGNGGKADREAPAFDDAQATLKISGVDTSASGDISDELYGVFLEDINYASYALDDNMVKNGSFQSRFSTRTTGWTAEKATLTAATADSLLGDLYKDYAGKYPVADYAKLVTQAGGALTNAGYDDVPMAVENGVDYVFSAFIRTEGVQNMTVTVTDGQTDYCTASIALSGSGWKKYRRTMTANGTQAEGLKLKLTFEEAGTVSLDGVTFETTDSTVGIKNYLYNAVKELQPKFIRFPGGCITEGENYNPDDEQAYDWKNSIGAVANGNTVGADAVPAFTYTLNTESGDEEVTTYGEFVTRKTNTNLWQNDGDKKYYQMEYGLGFYEYFLLCDSLGASALPVVNCGLSCQGQTVPAGKGAGPLPGRHNQNIADYIRDAADLIEFAKGDATSTTWGKVRAAMGHPEPFEMNYLGIGNEQWNTGEERSNYFTSYYEKFLEDDYFMQKCEQYGVQLIVGNHQQLVHCEGSIDFKTNEPRTTGIAKDAATAYMNAGKISSLGEYGVQDHHYYNSPVDFFLHAHMYDNYTRTGANRYEVFVGEYSANNTFREAGDFSSYYEINGWFSALSEAAMMTGFERNGDIVKLSAYAPMFAPVNAAQRDWPVDMMLFTNTELVRTANYYVQQIFMKNAGTKKLTSELNFASGVDTTFELESTSKPRTLDRIYYVASVDEATGDYIVKVVNADNGSSLRLNIDVGGAKFTGIASVTELKAGYGDVNTLEETPVAPDSYTVGKFSKSVAGFKLAPASVTVIRFHTK